MSTDSTNFLQRLHFIGICGTAMGAVAAAMQDQGYCVSVLISSLTPLFLIFSSTQDSCSHRLSSENLPQEKALIVVGNAISRGNPELEAVLNEKREYLSLPEVLHQKFLQERHNIVVTGTHGKTTTASLLAWIFEFAGKNLLFSLVAFPTQFCSRSLFS